VANTVLLLLEVTEVRLSPPPLGRGIVDTVLLLVVLTTYSIRATLPARFGHRWRFYYGALTYSP